MRPDPRDHLPEDDSGRIIYLGDVRKRAATSRRQSPDHHYLVVFLLVAVVAWGIWLAVVVALPPTRLLTYLAFFVPLSVALAATGAVGAYALDRRLGKFSGLVTSARRGAEFSVAVVANLALLSAHHWTLIVPLVTVILAAGTELVIARRESYR